MPTVSRSQTRSRTPTNIITKITPLASTRSFNESIAKRANGVQQQRFVLRRSAGLAFAFLSLMRAEPRSCVPLSFSLLIQQLLAEGKGVANGDAAGWGQAGRTRCGAHRCMCVERTQGRLSGAPGSPMALLSSCRSPWWSQ
jgi:hypothetical protein